jgi:hypothetical protein
MPKTTKRQPHARTVAGNRIVRKVIRRVPVLAGEVLTGAIQAYREHWLRFDREPPPEVSASTSTVDLDTGAIILRSADGVYLGRCLWAGKRVDYVPTCIDCQEPAREWYMVRDRLWEKTAGYSPAECACLACLAKRLGRPLRPGDFTMRPFATRR